MMLEEVPEALRNYCSLQLEIPKDSAQILLSDANLTVKEFIGQPLPKVSHQFIYSWVLTDTLGASAMQQKILDTTY